MSTWMMPRILVSYSVISVPSYAMLGLALRGLTETLFAITETASFFIGRSGNSVLTEHQVRNTRRSWPTNPHNFLILTSLVRRYLMS